jgi:SPP1 family predicted phage head-tail adaptor
MRLGNNTTNPGEMRTRVTILEREVTTNPGGFQVADLVELAEVWAKWSNVHGSESWIASSVEAESPATVLIRYLDGIDTSCYIQKGDQIYQIVSVDNIQERSEYIELKVKRWLPG